MLCVEQPESDPAPTGEPLPYDHEAHADAFHNAAIDAIKTHGINKITKPHPIFRSTHLEALSLKHDPLGHHAEKAHRASMNISKGKVKDVHDAEFEQYKNTAEGMPSHMEKYGGRNWSVDHHRKDFDQAIQNIDRRPPGVGIRDRLASAIKKGQPLAVDHNAPTPTSPLPSRVSLKPTDGIKAKAARDFAQKMKQRREGK